MRIKLPNTSTPGAGIASSYVRNNLNVFHPTYKPGPTALGPGLLNFIATALLL
jgi:hypothetical protein